MNFIFIGSLLAATAVALGAFGAHLLRKRTDEDGLRTWDTGIRYHMYHALGLIAIGLLQISPAAADATWLEVSGGLLLAGMLLFSGPLYLLVLSGRRWLGAIAPLGGLLLVAGWLALAQAVW